MKSRKPRTRSREFSPANSKYIIFTSEYIIPLLILITIILLGYVILKTSYFSISNIICTQEYEECQNEHLNAELERYRGDNIFQLDIDSIQSRIESGQKTVKQVTVTRQLPSTLIIELIPTTSIIALQLINTDQWIVLDERLLITKVTDKNPNLITILITQLEIIQVGQPITDPKLLAVLELTREISRQFFEFSSIELDDNIITLYLKNGQKALLTTSRETSAQLYTLQSILADDIITSDAVHTIDVRFTQPVLKSD